MRASALCLFVIAAARIGMPSTAAAQDNLLLNGGFDTEISPWFTPLSPANSVAHAPLDADGNPASGSAVVTLGFTSGADSIRQCVQNLSETQRYEASVMIHMPFPQDAPGEGWIRVKWYSGVCNGLISTVDGPVVQNLPFPVLFLPSTLGDLVPPPGTHSAWIWLVANKVAPGSSSPTEVFFDQASFRSLAVFADGFESGDTSGWSSAAP